MGIRAAVFDLDGVLIDSERLHQEAERNILADYGVAVTVNDIHSVVGLSARDVFTKILRNHGKKLDHVEDMVQEKWRIFDQEYLPRMELFPHALDLLTFLHPQVQLGLATSSRSSYQRNIFDRLGLNQYFKAIVTSDQVKNTKPHPEPYLLAMSRLNVDPSVTFVVEDSLFGVRSGKSAGATVIAVTHTLPREKLSEADYVIDSLKEIKEIYAKQV